MRTLMATVLAAGMLVTSGGEARAAGCRIAGAKVLAGSGPLLVSARGGRVRVCRRATGRSLVLRGTFGRPAADGYYVRRALAAGRFVAVVRSQGAESSGGAFFPDRLELLDGVSRRSLPLEQGCAPDAEGAASVLTSVALLPSGVLAWGCEMTVSPSGYHRTEVHARDHCGSRLLAASDIPPVTPDQIEGFSVALGGANPTAYWTSTSGAHAAALALPRASCP